MTQEFKAKVLKESMKYVEGFEQEAFEDGVVFGLNNIWHDATEFKGVKYMRINKKVLGVGHGRAEVGIIEVEDGRIDLLDDGGGCVMCMLDTDKFCYLDDILPKQE